MPRNHFSFDISFGGNNRNRPCLRSVLKNLLPTYESTAPELGGVKPSRPYSAHSPSKDTSRLNLLFEVPVHLLLQLPTHFSALPNPESEPSSPLPKQGCHLLHPGRRAASSRGIPTSGIICKLTAKLEAVTAAACTSQCRLVLTAGATW